MVYDFIADEMFQMATKIEENEARFYHRAAELQSDPQNREMLEKLGIMENLHKQTFEKIRY